MRLVSHAMVLGLTCSLAGCGLLGDHAGDRTLQFYQDLYGSNTSPNFALDTSHLPPGAIESRTEEDGRSGKTVRLKIRADVPIRVVLLPATQP